MALNATFERSNQTGITGAAGRAVAGIKKAMASISEGGGITLPVWFLSCVTAAFLMAGGGVLKVAWSTGEKIEATEHTAEDNKAAIAREDARIDRLETIFADIASMKSDIASAKNTAENTNSKVDRLIDRELSRGIAH